MPHYRVSGTAYYAMPFLVEVEAEDADAAWEAGYHEAAGHVVHSLDGERIGVSTPPGGEHPVEIDWVDELEGDGEEEPS